MRAAPEKHLLRAFLERNGFASAGTLNVSPSLALAEVNAAVERLQKQGLRPAFKAFTEATFKAALRDAGLATS